MLRTTLQHLRQTLAAVTDPATVLSTEQDTVYLLRDAITVDLDVLVRAEQALQATPPPQRKTLLPLLEAATAHLRGERREVLCRGDDLDRGRRWASQPHGDEKGDDERYGASLDGHSS